MVVVLEGSELGSWLRSKRGSEGGKELGYNNCVMDGCLVGVGDENYGCISEKWALGDALCRTEGVCEGGRVGR